MTARCRSCRAPIIWAVLPSGRRIPLDSVPERGGNIRLESIGPGTDRAAVVLHAPDLPAAWASEELLYRSHFATCPDAARHRRP